MKQYPWYNANYYNTYPEYIASLTAYGNAPAITSYDRRGNETTHTYRQLHDDVLSLQRALYAHELNGKHIAIAGENCYEWLLLFFAITCSGGVAVCVDIDQSDEAILDMIGYTDTEYVFASPSILPICRENFDTDHLFLLNEDAGELSHKSTEDFIEEGRKLADIEQEPIMPGQTAVIVFTSGTTARSKAVSLTHFGMLQNAAGGDATIDLGPSMFTGLPFHHAYGLNSAVMCPLLYGAHLCICGNVRTMVRDLFISNAETACVVPLLAEVLYTYALNQIKKDGYEAQFEHNMWYAQKFGALGVKIAAKKNVFFRNKYFGNLKMLVCGGAHLNEALSRNLTAMGIKVMQGYGITECSPLISVNRNDFWSYGTAGTVLPGYEVKISDDGEILVRGASLMAGYYKDPEATSEVIKDGWFHTGDLGTLDGDRQLTVLGRSKNLIVLKNGKKVSPEMLEQLLNEIPLVKECEVYGAVTGVSADDVKPAASIYPEPSLTAGMEPYEILNALKKEIDLVNATLPSYQQIQMVSIRETEFEKTSTKKIKRTFGNNHI